MVAKSREEANLLRGSSRSDSDGGDSRRNERQGRRCHDALDDIAFGHDAAGGVYSSGGGGGGDVARNKRCPSAAAPHPPPFLSLDVFPFLVRWTLVSCAARRAALEGVRQTFYRALRLLFPAVVLQALVSVALVAPGAASPAARGDKGSLLLLLRDSTETPGTTTLGAVFRTVVDNLLTRPGSIDGDGSGGGGAAAAAPFAPTAAAAATSTGNSSSSSSSRSRISSSTSDEKNHDDDNADVAKHPEKKVATKRKEQQLEKLLRRLPGATAQLMKNAVTVGGAADASGSGSSNNNNNSSSSSSSSNRRFVEAVEVLCLPFLRQCLVFQSGCLGQSVVTSGGGSANVDASGEKEGQEEEELSAATLGRLLGLPSVATVFEQTKMGAVHRSIVNDWWRRFVVEWWWRRGGGAPPPPPQTPPLCPFSRSRGSRRRRR